MKILVTGGCGFIGSNYIINQIKNKNNIILNLDSLTYAGNPSNLNLIKNHKNYSFIEGSICDPLCVNKTIEDFQPNAIVHFAAESHVDRSIDGPMTFINTNILGTAVLLESSLKFWRDNKEFRFLHVSTDEVYGSLGKNGLFTERTPYNPSSPYSSSKASSDFLVKAWNRTYGFPSLITNCSNNYGPYQFPEKLIPLCILNALQGKNLPIYGDGKQVRDWLYVLDHCKGIELVLAKGKIGATYNIGGSNEKTNIEVVHILCDLLDKIKPLKKGKSYKDQIIFVGDRPGHDRRYAIDATKITKDLGWKSDETFDTGIRETIQWYIDNQEWVKNIKSGDYMK